MTFRCCGRRRGLPSCASARRLHPSERSTAFSWQAWCARRSWRARCCECDRSMSNRPPRLTSSGSSLHGAAACCSQSQMDHAAAGLAALAPGGRARAIALRVGRNADHDMRGSAPGRQLRLQAALDDAHRPLAPALGELARELVCPLRRAIAQPQLRARQPRRDRLRQLAGAEQQGRPLRDGFVTEQPSHLRAVGGTAQMHQVLRTDRLDVLEQQLHPGGELPCQRRGAARELAPGLLDLAEDLGLGHQLALQAAGKAQQESIGIGALETLERRHRWEIHGGRAQSRRAPAAPPRAAGRYRSGIDPGPSSARAQRRGQCVRRANAVR